MLRRSIPLKIISIIVVQLFLWSNIVLAAEPTGNLRKATLRIMNTHDASGRQQFNVNQNITSSNLHQLVPTASADAMFLVPSLISFLTDNISPEELDIDTVRAKASLHNIKEIFTNTAPDVKMAVADALNDWQKTSPYTAEESFKIASLFGVEGIEQQDKAAQTTVEPTAEITAPAAVPAQTTNMHSFTAVIGLSALNWESVGHFLGQYGWIIGISLVIIGFIARLAYIQKKSGLSFKKIFFRYSDKPLLSTLGYILSFATLPLIVTALFKIDWSKISINDVIFYSIISFGAPYIAAFIVIVIAVYGIVRFVKNLSEYTDKAESTYKKLKSANPDMLLEELIENNALSKKKKNEIKNIILKNSSKKTKFHFYLYDGDLDSATNLYDSQEQLIKYALDAAASKVKTIKQNAFKIAGEIHTPSAENSLLKLVKQSHFHGTKEADILLSIGSRKIKFYIYLSKGKAADGINTCESELQAVNFIKEILSEKNNEQLKLNAITALSEISPKISKIKVIQTKHNSDDVAPSTTEKNTGKRLLTLENSTELLNLVNEIFTVFEGIPITLHKEEFWKTVEQETGYFDIITAKEQMDYAWDMSRGISKLSGHYEDKKEWVKTGTEKVPEKQKTTYTLEIDTRQSTLQNIDKITEKLNSLSSAEKATLIAENFFKSLTSKDKKERFLKNLKPEISSLCKENTKTGSKLGTQSELSTDVQALGGNLNQDMLAETEGITQTTTTTAIGEVSYNIVDTSHPEHENLLRAGGAVFTTGENGTEIFVAQTKEDIENNPVKLEQLARDLEHEKIEVARLAARQKENPTEEISAHAEHAHAVEVQQTIVEAPLSQDAATAVVTEKQDIHQQLINAALDNNEQPPAAMLQIPNSKNQMPNKSQITHDTSEINGLTDKRANGLTDIKVTFFSADIIEYEDILGNVHTVIEGDAEFNDIYAQACKVKHAQFAAEAAKARDAKATQLIQQVKASGAQKPENAPAVLIDFGVLRDNPGWVENLSGLDILFFAPEAQAQQHLKALGIKESRIITSQEQAQQTVKANTEGRFTVIGDIQLEGSKKLDIPDSAQNIIDWATLRAMLIGGISIEFLPMLPVTEKLRSIREELWQGV